MRKIKWMLCDDDDFLYFIYCETLKKCDELVSCGYAPSAAECPEMVIKNEPDVLLLDVQMETENAGIEIIPKLKRLAPEMKIIVLTGYKEEIYIFDSIANGADNYILKEESTKQLAQAIIDVYENKSSFSPEISGILASHTRKVEENVKSLLFMFEIMSRLSQSEYEILKCVYKGQSYKEIASTRFVAESTVRNHITRILKKFDMPSMNLLIKNIEELKLFEYLK